MSPPRRYAAPAFSPCPRASQGACAECVLAAPLVPLVGGRWRAPAAAAMSAEQVSGLCEQLVKAVTVIMDPASTQRYRLEALKVPPGRGERDGGREGGRRAPATRAPRPHGPRASESLAGRSRAFREVLGAVVGPPRVPRRAPPGMGLPPPAPVCNCVYVSRPSVP